VKTCREKNPSVLPLVIWMHKKTVVASITEIQYLLSNDFLRWVKFPMEPYQHFKWILLPHVGFGSGTFSNLVTGRKEKHGLIGTKWKGKAQQAEDKCQLYADVFLIAAEILSFLVIWFCFAGQRNIWGCN
jgi:hypothetical protein